MCTIFKKNNFVSPNRRSEGTFKEEQWQERQESLEDSLEKGKILDSSQREIPNSDKEDTSTEMYVSLLFSIHHCTVTQIATFAKILLKLS